MRSWYCANLCSDIALTSSIRSSCKCMASLFLPSSWFPTLYFVSPTSTEMIASLPYASRNGVSLVGILAVVLYAHKMLGNSFGHISFAPSSRVLIILSKDRFVTSTCPLAWGWVGDEYWFLIPNWEQKSLKASLSNCFPLFETSILGILYL